MDGDLPGTTFLKPSADHDEFNFAPLLDLEKSLDHGAELDRKILDDAVSEACDLRIFTFQKPVKLFFGNVAGVLIGEGIGTFPHQKLPPIVNEFPKSASARLIAYPSVLTANFQIVAIHLNIRQRHSAMNDCR